jgi:hypothetical protein
MKKFLIGLTSALLFAVLFILVFFVPGYAIFYCLPGESHFIAGLNDVLIISALGFVGSAIALATFMCAYFVFDSINGLGDEVSEKLGKLYKNLGR